MDNGILSTVNQNVFEWRNIEWVMDPDPNLGFTPLLDRVYSPSNFLDKTEKWINRPFYGAVDTLGGALNDGAGDTTLTADNPSWWFKGMLARIDSEMVLATDVNYTTGVVTIIRGYGGTTRAAHIDEATVYLMGPIIGEKFTNSDWLDNVTYHEATPTEIENYAQQYMFSQPATEMYKWEVRNGKVHPGTARLNWINEQVRRHRMNMEINIVMGLPSKTSDDTKSSTMGGIAYFIANKGGVTYQCDNNILNYHQLNEAVRQLYVRGGMPNLIICDMATKMVIDEGWEVNVTKDYATAAAAGNQYGSKLDRIKTSFGPGNIEIMAMSQLPANSLYILTTNDIKFGPVGTPGDSMGFRTRREKDGSVERDVVTGWYNMRIDNLPSAHCAFSFTSVDTDGK